MSMPSSRRVSSRRSNLLLCSISLIVAAAFSLAKGWTLSASSLPTKYEEKESRRRNLFWDPLSWLQNATDAALTSPFAQNLQQFAPPLPSFTPFYEPRQYSLHPTDAFEMHTLCTDINRPGCDENNTISFTTEANPAPNGFRYHDSGPVQMQGVFWTQQENVGLEMLIAPEEDNFASSDLVSFARTRHGGGINTGVLQTDSNGYEYVTRPLGDHSWSTSANSMETHLTSVDVLYIYDLTRGTLENPLSFDIITNFKAFFNCMRFSFGRFGGGT